MMMVTMKEDEGAMSGVRAVKYKDKDLGKDLSLNII